MHRHKHQHQKQSRKEAMMAYHSYEYFCEWWPTEVATLNSKSV